MAGARVIKLDSGRKIVRQLYKPGAPLNKWGTMVAKRAEELAKTNNGKGWVYQRPSQRVERYKGGNAHGRYAAGLRSSGGSHSDPTVRLEATATHSRWVEWGNQFGSRPIVRRDMLQARKALDNMDNAIHRLGTRIRSAEAVLKAPRGTYSAQQVAFVRQNINAWRRQRDLLKSKRGAHLANMKSRFALSTPGGIRRPAAIMPMGYGKIPSIAERGGYRTVNRAVREAVRQVARETRGK